MSVPTRAEILEALTGEAGPLWERAAAVRREVFGDAVRLRGVVEITNHCRKRCSYCGMSRDHRALPRFRADGLEEVFQAVAGIARLGLGTVLLQGGEDPRSDGLLEGLLPRIRSALGLRVILNVGERPRAQLARFREAGADGYLMKFETSDEGLYEELTGSRLADRLQNLRWLRELGFRVGVGNIVGLPGQTLASVAEDVRLACELRPAFVSASPFIPSEGTPLEQVPPGRLDLVLRVLALYRVLLPEALIPSVSALEKLEPGGQVRGLQAGANVLTANFTPPAWRERYVIYSPRRFVVSLEHARATAARAGLEVDPRAAC